MSKSTTLLALAVIAAGAAGQANAQQPDYPQLTLHGYLTQGVARSDSLQVIGIDKRGTTDYRRAALLLRYATSRNESFVVQLAHRRLGNSPYAADDPDVRLDWAYYERRFASNTRMKVGRSPIPMGIYNETRYAGNTQPFYRAPFSFYFEGAYTGESIDGAVVEQRLFQSGSFGTEVSAYGGQMNLVEYSSVPQFDTNGQPTGSFAFATAKTRARNVFGTQLWVSTPIDGVRLGTGTNRYSTDAGLLGGGETKSWHASFDSRFERALARAEYRDTSMPRLGMRAWYAQAGANLFGGLWLNGQSETMTATAKDIVISPVLPPMTLELKYNRDDAIGLNYVFSPHLVLKTEVHHMKGLNFEENINPIGAPLETNYAITSLSFAF